ncbi:protein winged eye isoform X2 [Culicoides brevitarsis]|uniref:protein winged eye isoform X2 n=1 Tax=Culicoides brevitarsis TaxID=469753 RepID=UPI00307B1716
MVKFDLWTRRKSLCLDKSSSGSSSCGQSVSVADSLYSSSSTSSQRTHLASSPPYLPQPPTHSTATTAPLDLTTASNAVSRHTETCNKNNNHSQENDNNCDEQQQLHGKNSENNANDGNNSAAVAFSQNNHPHEEFIAEQITKTSSAKSSYKWKYGKITTTTNTTVTHPTEVRRDLLEPLQIQIPTCLSHHLEESIMDTPFHHSFIATTSTSKIIHQMPPSASTSSSSSSLIVATPSTSRNAPQSNKAATIFHHQHQHQMSSSTTTTTTTNAGLDLTTAGCRRTIPITAWTTSAAMSYKHSQYLKLDDKNRSGATAAAATLTAAHQQIVQIKREIPDVPNNYQQHHNFITTTTNNTNNHAAGLRQTAVVKFERQSSRSDNTKANLTTTITNNSVTIMDGTNIATGQTTIPVGIAVARQRLQETAQATSPILKPDISRYGIGLSDLTGCTTPSLSQSMYFTGTNSTMLPLSDAMTMGVSTRQTPTLWQYPSATLPIEPILPSPVGYQLMREPSTGQLVMLPSTTTIEKVLCMSYATEPFQPTVVWPQYTQATAAYTSQPSQLMLPPQMSQALQPPPLAPLQLLGPDYLASATLHQHTQTQHTRLVALTADGKRKTANGMPLPLTSHAFVKIEDMSAGGMSPHQSLFEPEKCLQSQFAAAMAGQTDIQGQIFYQHPANLIQIAPQNQTTTIMESSTTECRPLSPVVHHPCLTPPPEEPQNDIHHDDERHHQTILPDVQDANIQTSPVMSEEENSNDDDTQNSAAVPESTTSQDGDMCMSSTFLQNHHSEDANAESCVVSSSETIVPTIKPKVEVVTPEKCVIFPSRFASSLNESISNNNNNATAPSGCDVSGLELLSRSIEVFHKKTTTTVAPANIKLEPLSPQPEPSCLSPTVPHHQMQQQHQPTHSDLGGLNLLCALAEQRFQEEVGSDANCKKSSPSSSSMEDYEARKRKHKHSSSKKSSKRSKRERSGDRKRKRYNNDDDRIKSSFHRIKQKYSKCSCPDRHDDGHRCHQSNWPTTEHIISVMETEVKDRLITMMRKREEVKREIVMAKNLKDIKTLSSDRESSATPPSLIMKPSSLSNLPSMKFSSIPALSPNFSSSSNSSTTMVEIPKVLSDTDSSKFDEQETSSSERSSKRKGGTPKRHDDSPNTETIVAKKPKSLIGYILASKDRVSDTNVKGMVYANSMEEMKMKNHKQYASPSLELYTTDSSDSSYNKAKQPSAFKYEHDDDSSKPSSSAFSIFGDKNELKKAHKRRHDKRKKTKKQLKEKRKIDARCILKPHQLDQDKLRVLTSMGGLFYAGCLSAIQAPDIYAVTLDGERGNRPHIMSREEILRDAIMEVAPRSAEELPIGTRICAYWSQQYRCLYPGTVTAPSSPDSDNEGKFVNVEFDDGDNGRISIEDIRFLLSNYPIVEYDADPLDRKGKQKRAPSTTLLEHDHILPACSNIFNATCVLNRNEVDAYREERKKLKKIHKEREREEERKHRKKYKCIEDECKHKKHKKRRKHKKHHHLSKEEAVDGHISPDDSVSQIGSFSQLPMNGSSTLTIEPKNAENVAAKDDTEEENGSTVTESSGSLYQPKFLKKATCQQGTSESSKIAAFLPARQLWTWQGKGFKRSTGRVKKQFYKTIQRGKETISVGDSAVFLSTGRPDRPYIGHIESMWETAANNMVVRVKWFYHPEETEGAPNMKYPGALFESPHEDENDVQTISHKCEVLPIDAYTAKFGDDPKKYKSIYDNNDTYYKAGFYDPTPRRIKMEENIPVLAENETWA